MKLNRRTINLMVSVTLIASLLMTGCAAPTAAPQAQPPTLDPATVVAAAVSTLQAQMTAEALANPSATPLPTATTIPTDTPVPPTPTDAATATPAATATSTVVPLSAEFLYATTYPENKRKFLPNETYGLALGFRNAGTVAWEPGYVLKLVSFEGEVTVQPEVVLSRAVAPGEKVEFNLWAFGSETITRHTWYFQIFTANGAYVTGGNAAFTYDSITN